MGSPCKINCLNEQYYIELEEEKMLEDPGKHGRISSDTPNMVQSGPEDSNTTVKMKKKKHCP
jgi:hypothetical protein